MAGIELNLSTDFVMKKWLLALFVLLILGCSERLPSSTERLYQRWKLVKTIDSNGMLRPAQSNIITEFRTDGTILYETDVLLCCVPSKIRLQGNTIHLLETTTIARNNTTCDCAPPSTIQINQLTRNKLALEFNYSLNNFRLKATSYYVAVR